MAKNKDYGTSVYDLIDTETNKVLGVGYVLTKYEASQKNYALNLNGIKLKYVSSYSKKKINK